MLGTDSQLIFVCATFIPVGTHAGIISAFRTLAHICAHNLQPFCNWSSCSTNNSPQGGRRGERSRMNLSSRDFFSFFFPSSLHIFLLRKLIRAASLRATDTLFTPAEHEFFFCNSIFFPPTSQKKRENFSAMRLLG